MPGAVSTPTRRAEGVGDGERTRLVASLEIPDDPHDGVVAQLDAEGARPAGIKRRLVTAPEGDSSLGDGRVHQRLALPKGYVAVPEEEVAREADLEALAHTQRAVGLDVDRDVGLEQREAVGARGAGEGEARCGGECRER